MSRVKGCGSEAASRVRSKEELKTWTVTKLRDTAKRLKLDVSGAPRKADLVDMVYAGLEVKSNAREVCMRDMGQRTEASDGGGVVSRTVSAPGAPSVTYISADDSLPMTEREQAGQVPEPYEPPQADGSPRCVSKFGPDGLPMQGACAEDLVVATMSEDACDKRELPVIHTIEILQKPAPPGIEPVRKVVLPEPEPEPEQQPPKPASDDAVPWAPEASRGGGVSPWISDNRIPVETRDVVQADLELDGLKVSDSELLPRTCVLSYDALSAARVASDKTIPALRPTGIPADPDSPSYGALLYRETRNTMAVSTCAGDGTCGSGVAFVELMAGNDKGAIASWSMRAKQYASFGTEVLEGHSLRVARATLCDAHRVTVRHQAVDHRTGKPVGEPEELRGVVAGVIVMEVPPGMVLAPLRTFIVAPDAIEPLAPEPGPSGWGHRLVAWTTAPLRRACTVAYRASLKSPWKGMEDRFARSSVAELISTMWARGVVPETVSPESFGVLLRRDKGVPLGWVPVRPVLLPSSDVLMQLPVPAGEIGLQLASLNTRIVYESIVVGQMRNGAPANYAPSNCFLSTITHSTVTPVVDTLVVKPLGMVAKATGYVVRLVDSAPLIIGFRVSDAMKAVSRVAGAVARPVVGVMGKVESIVVPTKFMWVVNFFASSAIYWLMTVFMPSIFAGPGVWIAVRTFIAAYNGKDPIEALQRAVVWDASTAVVGAAAYRVLPAIMFGGAPRPINCPEADVIRWEHFRAMLKLVTINDLRTYMGILSNHPPTYEIMAQVLDLFNKGAAGEDIPYMMYENGILAECTPQSAVDAAAHMGAMEMFFATLEKNMEQARYSVGRAIVVTILSILYHSGKDYVCQADYVKRLNERLQERERLMAGLDSLKPSGPIGESSVRWEPFSRYTVI